MWSWGAGELGGNKSGTDSRNYFTEKNSLSPKVGSATANHLIQDVLAGVRKIYRSQLSDRFSEIW